MPNACQRAVSFMIYGKKISLIGVAIAQVS